MQSLALPLRLDRLGRVQRVDRADAVVALMGVMLGMSTSAWPHAPWFGLYELGLQIRPGESEPIGLRDALNEALRELSITDVRVDQLRAISRDGKIQLVFGLTIDGTTVFRDSLI